jgi:hypothetical protein
LRTVLLKEWRNLKDHDTVRSGVEVLCAHGHIEEFAVPGDGVGRKTVHYAVNPKLK